MNSYCFFSHPLSPCPSLQDGAWWSTESDPGLSVITSWNYIDPAGAVCYGLSSVFLARNEPSMGHLFRFILSAPLHKMVPGGVTIGNRGHQISYPGTSQTLQDEKLVLPSPWDQPTEISGNEPIPGLPFRAVLSAPPHKMVPKLCAVRFAWALICPLNSHAPPLIAGPNYLANCAGISLHSLPRLPM